MERSLEECVMEKKKKSVFKIPCLVIFTIFISLSAYPVFAETKTFIKEYTYQASEADSKLSSRTVSLREVKRLLLEELGTYLESITEVKNFHLTKDQIVTLTAGIVSTEVVEERWDGKIYWFKAKITADQESVIKSIDKLRQDRQKVKELEETRKRSEALLKENERLKKELLTARGEKKQETEQAYQRNIANLTATEWFEKGTSLYNSGNYKDAAKALDNAIELNPKNEVLYGIRGAIHMLLGNHQQSIKDFSKAIELGSQSAFILSRTHYLRGTAYNAVGNYQQAIEDCNKAIELDSQDYDDVYRIRGAAYSSLGNDSQAIKDFDRAIEMNPQSAYSYSDRGTTYRRLGNYQQAIEDYNEAIRLKPDHASAYMGRGNVYGENLGQYQRAMKDFKEAIRLKPDYADAYYNRGAAYGKLNQHQRAIEDYNKAIRLNPNYTNAYNNRGAAYLSMGNKIRGCSDAQKVCNMGDCKLYELAKKAGYCR
jgi:tetratricopeptide (TPR) repeat protein